MAMDLFKYKNDKQIKKRTFIWNTVASLVNAAEAVLVLAVASRTVTIQDVGVMSFGFVVANLLLCVSKYGVRNYQVSDVTYKGVFADYLYSRCVTLLFALFIAIVFIIWSIRFNDYSIKKALTISAIIMIYQIEAIEDVFLAETQRKGRLDIGAKMFSVRWAVTLLVWVCSLLILKDIFLSSLISFGIDFACATLFLSILYRYLKKEKSSGLSNILTILKNCTPICVAMLLAIYIPNAAKYAIDLHLDGSIQAIYGYISMPVFVLDVVSFVIFQPQMLEISMDWHEKNYVNVIKKVGRISLILSGLSLLYVIVSFYLGIPILSLIYGIDLAKYKGCFVALVYGSIALAFASLFASVLTIMRKQFVLMLIYALVALLMVVLLNYYSVYYGLFEVTIVNVSGIFMLALLTGGALVLFVSLKLKKRVDD